MLNDILDITLTRCHLDSKSRKRALEDIAAVIHQSKPEISAKQLFKLLVEREQIGSTGLGHGVAIPHCRSSDFSEITGCFVSLTNGIDFEAIDDKPVDILFALIVPEQETSAHLDILAVLAGTFSQASALESLRACNSDAELLTTLLAHVKSASTEP